MESKTLEYIIYKADLFRRGLMIILSTGDRVIIPYPASDNICAGASFSSDEYETDEYETDEVAWMVDEEDIVQFIEIDKIIGIKLIDMKKSIEKRERIGSRIAELRRERGMSQAQLAEATGLKQPNIARIEAGKYSTTLDLLTTIADALGVKVDFI